MFTNILLSVDGSAPSLRVARRGLQLARILSARVTALTVTTPWVGHLSRELAVMVLEVVVPQGEYDYKRETVAACILQTIVWEAHSRGVMVTPVHRCHREPYRAMIDLAEREGCDLIVVGAHYQNSVSDSMLSSETIKVMTHTSIPVLLCREKDRARDETWSHGGIK